MVALMLGLDGDTRRHWASLRRGLAMMLDTVLPPRCLACGGSVGRQGEVCALCWPRLRFLHPPWCEGCGLPMPGGLPEDLVCEACRRQPQPWDRGRSALAYDDGSRGLILGFKHRDRIEAVESFARWMALAGSDLLAEAELILPVPIHRWRLLRRGYNQAGLLAGRLSRLSRVAWHPQLLVRSGATASQQGLGARARARNVTADAFVVPPRAEAQIRDRKLLLVDDVLTTGATLAACVAVLRRSGARSVDTLTLARVVREPVIPIS